MRFSIGKRLEAITLILALMLGFVPFRARAAEANESEQPIQICEDGQHIPGEKQAANYTPCGGGFKTEWCECTVCGQPCDENSKSAEWCEPTQSHNPGEKQAANYTPCGGGFKTEWYDCTVCHQPVDADGNPVEWCEPDPDAKHTLGEKHEADYTGCFGGFKDDFYECEYCHCPVNADGEEITGTEGVGHHTPDLNNPQEPDYTPCCGGFDTAWYICSVCGNPSTADGDWPEWKEPDPGAKHTLGEKQEANYTPCGGGFKSAWYECTLCHQSVDANGDLVEWCAPDPDAKHTLGEQHEADYTPCFGGFKDDFYVCEYCHCPVNADGEEIMGTEGVGHHTPDLNNPQEPDYTPCFGGFDTAWYICSVCGNPSTADGDWPEWKEPNASHTLEKIDATAPTYESEGNIAFWHCTTCGSLFQDAEGTELIEDLDEIILPKLDKPEGPQRVEITDGLTKVPDAVAEQYATVTAIQNDMEKAAVASSTVFTASTVTSVMMDVELQIQQADGTWIPVTAENFPAEGVEVTLPYPDGTDKDGYRFVVTHMITSGAKAGEIEILNGVPEDDGIRVTFTSMSPVVITYQENKPAAPCDGGDTCPSHGFADLDPAQWYHQGVDYVISSGLMVGVSETSFAPNTTTSRAMLVTVLYRLEGEPAVGACSFTDVKSGQWYANAIAWAAENGIVVGYGNGKFGPDDTLTREQSAAILYRYAACKGYDVTAQADLSSFTDGGATESWARNAMSWAVAEGLLVGMGDGKLAPQGNAERAQTAAILYRFCENVA